MAPANLPESRDEPATNFHPWSCLPDELQLEVLGHLLSESEPVTHAKHEDHRHRQTGLFNVITTQNRDLVSRAIEAYYKNNIFIVGKAYPSPHHGHLVQRMKIEATSTMDVLLHSRGRWLLLGESIRRVRSFAVEEEYRQAPTLSLATFLNLKHLELNLVVLSNSEDLSNALLWASNYTPAVNARFQCYQAKVAALESWGFVRSQARIKAKEVTVRVWSEGCRRQGVSAADVHHSATHEDPRTAVQQLPPTPCACEEKLHYMLKGVFTKKSGATDMRQSYRGEQ